MVDNRPLIDATDAELEAALRDKAHHTVYGTGPVMDEMNRRAAVRSAEATEELARRSYWLSVVGLLLAAIATIAAVLALLRS